MITSEKLVERVKRRSTAPENQNRFTNEDILELISECFLETVVPEIKQAREDYFIVKDVVPMVAGQKAYAIPHRALGSTLREIKVRHSLESTPRNVPLLTFEEGTYAPDDNSSSAAQWGFYFRGDEIVLTDFPFGDSGYIDMYYELTPSEFVPTSQCAKVISTSDDTITVESTPSEFVVGLEMDVIKGRSSHSLRMLDKELIASDANVLTFASGVVPNSVAKGDFVSIAGNTCLMPGPNSAFPYLVELAAERVLFELGDMEGAAKSQEKAKDLRSNMLDVIEPRITSSPKKIVGRHGLLSRYRPRNRRGGLYY